MVDPTGLLPDDRTSYRYAGSLTTPPCSEGVDWLVMRESIEVSDDQVARFADRFGENARPLQDRNDREVILSPDEAS